MPSLSTVHYHDLRAIGEVPDLYRVFGEFQMRVMPWAGCGVTVLALQELARVIGLPTWVVTPEMVSEMMESVELWSGASRRSVWSLLDDTTSCFAVELMYWADRIVPERRDEIELAAYNCVRKLKAGITVNFKPKKRRRSRRRA